MFSSNSSQREASRRSDAPNFVPDTRQERGENSRLRTLAQRIPRLNAVPTNFNIDRPSSSNSEFRSSTTDNRVQNNSDFRQNDLNTSNSVDIRNMPNTSTSNVYRAHNSNDYRVQNASSDSRVTPLVFDSSEFRLLANGMPNDNVRIIPWSERSRSNRSWDNDYVLRLPVLDLSMVQANRDSQQNHSLNNEGSSTSQDSTDMDYN